MKLTDLLAEDCLCVPLVAPDKFAAIESLVNLLAQNRAFLDRSEVHRAVVEREQKQSTGMELGLAVPHAKTRGCAKPVMAVGLAKPPIDFQGADGKPASVIVLLASPPDQTAVHIQALARISRLMFNEGFRSAIAAAADATEAYQVIARYDH